MNLDLVNEESKWVVSRLRAKKLREGYPFMINVSGLADYQFYYEYPDGTIELVYVTGSTKEINTLKRLSTKEADQLRARLKLEPIV